MDIKEIIEGAKEYWSDNKSCILQASGEALRETIIFFCKAMVIVLLLILGIKYLLKIGMNAPGNTETYKLTNIIKVSSGDMGHLTFYVKNGNVIKPINTSCTYEKDIKYVVDAKESIWAELADCEKLDESTNYIDYAIIHVRSIDDIP